MKQQSVMSTLIYGLALGTAVAIGGAVAARTPAVQHGEASAGKNNGKAFVADVVTRHQSLDASGAVVRSSPPRSVRVERREHGAKWRTTFWLRADEPVPIDGWQGPTTLNRPRGVERIEIDEDGSEPRLYGPTGLLKKPDPNTPPWPLSDEARAARQELRKAKGRIPNLQPPADLAGLVAGLIINPDEKSTRRKALEARFGAPLSRVRGLDRFVSTEGDVTHEVLVDPAANVPVEMNMATRGKLVRQTTFGYATHPTGLYRRLVRSERVVDAAQGGRLRSETEITALQILQDGVR